MNSATLDTEQNFNVMKHRSKTQAKALGIDVQSIAYIFVDANMINRILQATDRKLNLGAMFSCFTSH